MNLYIYMHEDLITNASSGMWLLIVPDMTLSNYSDGLNGSEWCAGGRSRVEKVS